MKYYNANGVINTRYANREYDAITKYLDDGAIVRARILNKSSKFLFLPEDIVRDAIAPFLRVTGNFWQDHDRRKRWTTRRLTLVWGKMQELYHQAVLEMLKRDPVNTRMKTESYVVYERPPRFEVRGYNGVVYKWRMQRW